MGRFHVCMPVVDGDDYRCGLCRRDMNAEMAHYAADASRPAEHEVTWFHAAELERSAARPCENAAATPWD